MLKQVALDHESLPKPWELNDEWMERLEIPEALRRHYFHLTEPERMKLEADRLLIEDYKQRDLLVEGRTTHSLISRMANDMDRHWLRPGKGRAIDFKKTLEVLELYARYSEWTTQFHKGSPGNSFTVLDFILPYWGKDSIPGYRSGGPGFLQIKCSVWHPEIGKLGEVHWGQIVFDFTEKKMLEPWMPDEIINPFNQLNTDEQQHRLFSVYYDRKPDGLGRTQMDSFGLLARITDPLHRLFNGATISGASVEPLCRKDQYAKCSLSMGCSTGRIQWDSPEVKQVEEVLETIAYWYFNDWRYPKNAWQLQFEVAPNLTKIIVASTLFETGPFDSQCGAFWRNKDRVTSLVWQAPDENKPTA